MQAGIGAAASLGRPSPSVAIVCRTTLDAMWLAQDAADSRTEMDTRQQRAYLSSYDRPRRSRNTARRLQQAEPRRVRVRSQFPIRARTATVGAARGRLARRQRQRPLSQVRSSECELRVSCQTGACASCARRQWPPQQQVAATAQLREQLPPRAAPCAATFKSIFAFTFATGPTAAAAASAGRDAASERRAANGESLSHSVAFASTFTCDADRTATRPLEEQRRGRLHPSGGRCNAANDLGHASAASPKGDHCAANDHLSRSHFRSQRAPLLAALFAVTRERSAVIFWAAAAAGSRARNRSLSSGQFIVFPVTTAMAPVLPAILTSPTSYAGPGKADSDGRARAISESPPLLPLPRQRHRARSFGRPIA